MHREESCYESIPFIDQSFPIRILTDLITHPPSPADPPRQVTWHEQLEILYVLRGRLVCECDFCRFECVAGDIVMINPCETHAIGYGGETACYHCIMIDPRLCGSREDVGMRKFIDPITDRRVRFRHLLRDNAELRAILEQLICEHREAREGYELAVRGKLLCLLALLYRYEVSDVREEKRSNDAAVLPALRYIADHYSETVTLDQLAAACCINRSYFCRRFRALTGRAAMQYLCEYRLAKAKALLLTTRRSVSDIAGATGFDDSSYFARRFKAFYGVSPAALRRQTAERTP